MRSWRESVSRPVANGSPGVLVRPSQASAASWPGGTPGAPLLLFQQDHHICNGGIFGAHAFRRFCFDSDTVRGNSAQLGDLLANGVGVRADFWSGQDQRGIQIHESVARGLDALQRLAQKHGGVGVFPLRIGRRKQRSNVGAGDGAEQRVSDRVQQDVAVGMAAETLVVRQSHAPDFERNAGFEFVRVPTVADAHFRFQDFDPVVRVWPAGAKARVFVVLSGTAEAVPFPFVLAHSSRIAPRRGKPRLYTSFSASCEAVAFPKPISWFQFLDRTLPVPYRLAS